MDEVFRIALDAHPDTIVLVDARRMSIVHANLGGCRTLGYRREELIGRSPEVLFADRDTSHLLREYERLKEDPDPAEAYEALLVRKDGSVFPVEISRALIRHEGTDYILGIARDITERRALAERKDAFVAAVSHELRTPLAGIVASLELLKEGSAGELPPEAQRFVDMACANSERLTELIRDVIDLERAGAGRARLEIERIEVASLLEEAASANAPYAARHRAHLDIDAQAGLYVLADRNRLLQVVANLISNAAKFSPEGGEIRLTARPADAGRVVLGVSDQGPGVPDHFKPRLFGRFEQADPSRGGSGLGLAICRALVERMGGRIWCESAPGKGAEFFVELPAGDPAL